MKYATTARKIRMPKTFTRRGEGILVVLRKKGEVSTTVEGKRTTASVRKEYDCAPGVNSHVE